MNVTRTTMAHLTAATSLLAGTMASAAIVANFSGAPGDVDGYPGIAGSGWYNAWNVGTSTSNASVGVETLNPLTTGGGNYVSVVNTRTGTSGFTALRRQYGDGTGDVSLSAAHTVSFDIRFDGTTGAWNDASGDYIEILDRATDGTSTSTNATWDIRAKGGSNPKWRFHSTSAFTEVESGVDFTVGTVYHISILLDPVNHPNQYKPAISSATQTSTDVGWLSFRSAATTTAGHLHFVDRSSLVNESHTFSVDNISIQVPEPAGLGLLALGGMLSRRRRRR